jgi:hypothetical protein
VPIAKNLLSQIEETLRSEALTQTAPPTHLGQEAAEPSARPIVIAKVPEPAPGVVPAASTTAPAATRPARATLLAAATPERKVEATHSPRIATWVTAGVAVVALGTGTLFGLQARSTAASITGSQHPQAEVDQLNSQLKSQALRANVLFGVSAGATLLSAAFFVLHF